MKPIWWIVVILLIVVAAYYGYKYYSNRNIKKVSGGRALSQDDINCATGTITGKIIGSCTKPRIPLDKNGNVPKPMRQKCFTSEELGLQEGDSGPSMVTEQNGLGTTWYLNFQSGDNFCYTNPQWYKN